MRPGVLRGRATTTVLDQAFSSGSNFLVAIVIARLTTPSEFGAFALAYSVWLLVVGLHRALVVNPMMISAPGARQDSDRLQSAVAAELVLALVAGGVVGLAGALLHTAGMGPLGWALMMLAPWLPALLVQDLWRWVGFMRAEPAKVLANDITFTVVQGGLLTAFALGGRLGVGTAIAAWGAGASVGVALGTWQFRGQLQLTGGWAGLRRSWTDGRWLLADFLTSYLASQGWQVLVAATLGPAGLGLVRAAYNLMGPTHVLLFSGSGYGLPACVEAFHDGGWRRLDAVVRRLATWMALGVGAYGLTVALGHDWLVRLVYGPQYQGIDLLVVLAASSMTLIAVAFGAGIGLTAARRTRALFLIRVSSAAVSLGFLLVFTGAFGVAAAGWANLLAALTYAALMWTAYRTAGREPKDAQAGGPDRARQQMEISVGGADDG